MRIGRRVAKVMVWGIVLCLSILGGGLWFAYTYVTDSETAARVLKQYLSRYLPGSDVDPGRVRLKPFLGELTLNNAQIFQRIDARPFQALRIPWLRIGIDTRKFLRGQLDLRHVLVVQPSLRLCYRRDGSLNLKGLLADPWPGPLLDKTPPIVIQDGTLELVPDEEGPPEIASPGNVSRNPEEASPVLPPTSGPSPSRPLGPRGVIVLREVSIHIKQVGALLFVFEGSARGDSLDRLQLHGSIDLATGRMTLTGNLDALTLSDALQRRLPREVRPIMKALAMTGGVVDLDLKRATYDPKAAPENRLTYAMEARLHEGVWECPKLPFHVNNFTAIVGVEDGLIHIKHAEGFNGRTTLRARGTLRAGEPQRVPMDLHVELIDLDLDPRLREKTPAAYDDLWDVFQPRGRVDAEVDVTRAETGGEVELGAKVTCRDVAANYRHFAYPVDHLTGELTLKKKILAVDLKTISVGGRPLRLKGTINNPGVNAVVALELWAESVPIDAPLIKAFKPEVRKVVAQFSPRGDGPGSCHDLAGAHGGPT